MLGKNISHWHIFTFIISCSVYSRSSKASCKMHQKCFPTACGVHPSVVLCPHVRGSTHGSAVMTYFTSVPSLDCGRVEGWDYFSCISVSSPSLWRCRINVCWLSGQWALVGPKKGLVALSLSYMFFCFSTVLLGIVLFLFLFILLGVWRSFLTWGFYGFSVKFPALSEYCFFLCVWLLYSSFETSEWLLGSCNLSLMTFS